ncbi:MAG: glycosyltransferase [Opitutaceae bacterium]|nr:glycosyltransferase [Opitutaceae bacterium]
MKICDIAQFYSPLSGGVKRYLMDKQRSLAARPGAHHVLIVPSHRDAVTRSATSTLHEVRSPRLIGSASYRLLISRKKILQIVRAEQPDLIEVGDPYRTAWIGLEAGAELGVPVVAFYHSDFPRAIGRTVIRFAGETIQRMISGPVQRYIVRLYNRMSATVVSTRRLEQILDSCGIERLVHVPLGTDIHTFQPQASRERLRSELGLAPGTQMLLFVGRIAREKNIRSLVAALDHIAKDAPSHHLVLVGDGELREQIEREVTRRDNVTWLPYCESPQKLAELYTAADLFVHPGRYETFGLVALEAQACGTPVLVVREGGVEDAVEGEHPPLIARDGSPRGLGAAIEHFLRAGDTPERRAARRRRIERHFAVERTFDRMLSLYEHLIARRPAAEFPAVPTAVTHHHEVPRPPVSTR